MHFQIGFSHKLWRKPTPAIGESTFSKVLWAETSNTNFPPISEHCPTHQLDLRGVLPKVLILSRFLPLMPSSRMGWYSSPASLAAIIFQRGFAFWASCGFFTLHRPAHFFVGIIHFSPVFSFDAFTQRLTEGTPVVIHHRRTPSLCGRD